MNELHSVFFKPAGSENFLGGKKVHCCFHGDYADGKQPPPIKHPKKTRCQNCERELWASAESIQNPDIINVCEPCYLVTFRGYVRRQAYPERN